MKNKANRSNNRDLFCTPQKFCMQTFRKSERLANFRLRALLFSEGNSFFQYPFRIQWLCFSENKKIKTYFPYKSVPKSATFDYPAKCLISVSKRQIRKAVHRNLIKRLIRETYRKNKNHLYAFLNTENMVVLLACIYTANRIMTYAEIEAAMQKAMEKLSQKLKTQGDKMRHME